MRATGRTAICARPSRRLACPNAPAFCRTPRFGRPARAPCRPRPTHRGVGGRPSVCAADGEHRPVKVKDLAFSLAPKAWRTITWREGTNVPLRSRFARLRVRVATRDFERSLPWPEEWLMTEWPKGEKEPTKYWLSTLPAN